MKNQKSRSQKAGLILGPVVFVLLLVFEIAPGNAAASMMAATAALMAIYWMTEAIPLAATALLPVVLFPLLGIMTGRDTAPVYFNSTIFLFLGGLLFALPGLIKAGIFLFTFVVFFQLVTLPVELNASKRALAMLTDTGAIYQEEVGPTKAVLNAAALTYVAGLVMALLQLLRLLLIAGALGGDE